MSRTSIVGGSPLAYVDLSIIICPEAQWIRRLFLILSLDMVLVSRDVLNSTCDLALIAVLMSSIQYNKRNLKTPVS
jgi:hypothetical protein